MPTVSHQSGAADAVAAATPAEGAGGRSAAIRLATLEGPALELATLGIGLATLELAAVLTGAGMSTESDSLILGSFVFLFLSLGLLFFASVFLLAEPLLLS